MCKKQKKLRVYYAKVNNMGDNLNKAIIEKCFGYEVVRSSYVNSTVSGIGSCLGELTYTDSIKKNIKKFFSSLVYRKIYVWGTGFIEYEKKPEKFFKKNTIICAVRGNLTRQRVEKMLNKKLEVPMADPGILASYLLDELPEKKYDVGIIAHFREKDNKVFKELVNKFSNSIFIDVQDDPINVTKKIAQCKNILSSSLHGLIISDSLHIPNKHIVVTNNLLGDGYKFDDYYSGYGLTHEFIDLNKEKIDDIGIIKKEYKITNELIEAKKAELIKCFPIKHEKNELNKM